MKSTALKLFIILLLVAIVRLWYVAYAGGTVELKPDSQGYYVEENFFGPHVLTNFFNPNRTPGYTMLTSLIMRATGSTYPLYNSPEFKNRIRLLIPIQMIVSLLSLVFLFDILRRLKISENFALAFVAFTGLNIYQFIWDRAILTESLYISFFLILMWLFVRLLQKPATALFVWFTLLAGYAFLLRPAGLAIPFLLLPLVYLSHRTKRVCIAVVVSLLMYTAVPAAMLGANRVLYGFRGISFNTDFSVFGRILLYDIPIEGAQSVHPWFERVTEYKKMGGNVSIPWYFFVYYNNDVYHRVQEIQKFNTLVIADQPIQFFSSVVRDIPQAFLDTNVYGVLFRSPEANAGRLFFDFLDNLTQFLQKSSLLSILLVIPMIWFFWKKPSPTHTFLLAIILIEAYQLCSSLIFGGAWEFARHMITTQTYLFFFCFWWIGRLWKSR